MKKVIKLLLLGVLIILNYGFTSRAEEQFKDPQWKDNETQFYNISKGEHNIGDATYQIRIKKINGVKAYVIDYEAKFKGRIDTSLITIGASDLKPISTQKEVTSTRISYNIKAEYLNNKVKLLIQTTQGAQRLSYNLSQGTYDNEELLMLLRALPFKIGYQTELAIFSLERARSFPLAIKVQVKETISVPAGVFTCYKVEFAIPGQTQHAWYAVNPPHHLVKYEAGNIIFRLKQYHD